MVWRGRRSSPSEGLLIARSFRGRFVPRSDLKTFQGNTEGTLPPRSARARTSGSSCSLRPRATPSVNVARGEHVHPRDTQNAGTLTSEPVVARDRFVSAHSVPDAAPCCAPRDRHAAVSGLQPRAEIPRKVMKGGSHLCAPNYCLRYRPTARQGETITRQRAHRLPMHRPGGSGRLNRRSPAHSSPLTAVSPRESRPAAVGSPRWFAAVAATFTRRCANLEAQRSRRLLRWKNQSTWRP
jgi:hypothetical protein